MVLLPLPQSQIQLVNKFISRDVVCASLLNIYNDYQI